MTIASEGIPYEDDFASPLENAFETDPGFSPFSTANLDLPTDPALIVPTEEWSDSQELFSDVLEDGMIYSSRDKQFGPLVRSVAQKLHTQTYLREAYIKPDDLSNDGLYHQYADRSTYFYRRTARRAVAVRQIECGRGGLLTLPTAHNFEIDPDRLKAAAGVEKLRDISKKKTVEISALASQALEGPADAKEDLMSVPLLYSEMLRHSLEQGQEYWLLNTYDSLARNLRMLIGKDQLHQIGEARDYLGSVTTPYLIKPQDVVRTILSSESRRFDFQKAHLKHVFDGIDDRLIPKDIRLLMDDNGIEANKTSDVKRIVTNPRVLAMSGLAAYCTARVLPFGGIEEFDGSIAALWAIDIGTVPTYVKGVEMATTGKTATTRSIGYTMATGSFAAPYVYAISEGKDYPPAVNIGIGAFAGAAVVSEVVQQYRTRYSEKRLIQGLQAAHEEDA